MPNIYQRKLVTRIADFKKNNVVKLLIVDAVGACTKWGLDGHVLAMECSDAVGEAA